MRRYENLPSISVEIQDGNLRVDNTPRGPVSLVIGTAVDGPNETQYLVTDSNDAAILFGATSPIMKRVSELKLGGTRNILAYRIGGVSASIVDLFGAGTEITAKEKNVASNTKYKAYIGPDPTDEVTPVIIIFEGDKNKIIYSTVSGAEVDNNKFDVDITKTDGTDGLAAFNYRVGTPTAPVALEDVFDAGSIREDFVDSYSVGVGGESNHNLTGATTPGTTVESITVNGTPLVDGTDYTFAVGTDVVTWTPGLVDTDAVVIKYSRPVTVAGASYVAGADNTACTWMKLYELLDSAYTNLETTLATDVVVDRAILDAPNLADGATATDRLNYLRITEVDGQRVYTWNRVKTIYSYTGATDDDTHNPSNSVHKNTGLADPTKAYLPPDSTTVLADAAKDANGQPIILQTYSEVNFAHQLGMWCHTITENERFVLGSIGVAAPESTSVSNLAKWIGTLPQTDASGVITANGSGLLGNKFMVGSTARTPGFFGTDSGLVDGNVLTDSKGAVVDLGKFLNIVAGMIVTPNSATIGSKAALVNGAAVYASVLSTVTPGNSTTNRVIPGIALPFTIKKSKLDELSFAKYVCFADTAQGVAVVSGNLPTASTSDYKYVSTSIIVASVVTAIRNRLQPYLGKGINQTLISAAETAVEDILQSAVEDGAIIKYKFAVLPGSTVYKLKVPLVIVPAFELREVEASLALAFDV